MTISDAAVREAHAAQAAVDELRRSSLASIAMLALGVVVVAGSGVYSVRRLRPLEQQIAARQTELQALEAAGQRLVNENAALQDSVAERRAQLERARSELVQHARSPSFTARTLALSAISALDDTTSARPQVVFRPGEATPASPALRATLEGLFSDHGSARLQAYDRLMTEFGHDPALVPALLAYAGAHRDNLNGLYNTLVVLSHLDRPLVAPWTPQVQAFATQVEGSGDRIAERVRVLRSRMRPAASPG